ncbi:MAG: hypothetical protein LBE76_00870 [Nitrososphaerota archaeon]|jgi:ribonucleoside-triphosphate reductase|nr:hypothetical protein [Nitrososphaerota archaeon]
MGYPSTTHRTRGIKVLKAISSPLRLQLLNLLFDKGALSYTELMNYLKMNPNRDAGRFAYHLKALLKTDMVGADSETKKYFLTELGKMLLDIADRVEKKTVAKKGMIVRTSRFTLEEFDQNKIANSLIKEAKVPPELAQKAAKETEKRLIKSKTKYVTAALIREMVNAILVEKGFEDYRHKLTRVGMPIHEVNILLENKDHPIDATNLLTKAAQTVLGEYTLLNMFSRDIADAHLSGNINIDNIGDWLLKPNEITHDIRYFLQNGLKLDHTTKTNIEPPQTFEAALNITLNALIHTQKEISQQQTISYFNTLLAPYTMNTDTKTIKNQLQHFLQNLNQHTKTTIEIDLTIPPQLTDKTAITPKNQQNNNTQTIYNNYQKETQQLADLLLQTYHALTTEKPLTNPKIIIRISHQTINNPNTQQLLLKAHTIATQQGMIYFANTTTKENTTATFSSTGTKLITDITNDWETDTLRTGNIGSVTINLPRIIQEAENDKNKLFDILKEQYDIAARALNIKHNTLKQLGKNTLPFLLKNTHSDPYLRLDNCTKIINLAGLTEAIETFTKKNIHDTESQKLLNDITQTLTTIRQKNIRKHGKRLYNTIINNKEASERLAQLDIEKYGIAKIKYTGTRDKPYYTTTPRLKPQTNTLTIPTEETTLSQKIFELTTNGTLTIINLDTNNITPEELLNLTRHLITQNKPIDFFTYNRILTYCRNCKKIWFGIQHKCSTCNSMSTLNIIDQFNAT